MKERASKACGCLLAIIGVTTVATSFTFLVLLHEPALVVGLVGGGLLLMIGLGCCCKNYKGGGGGHKKSGHIIPGHYDNDNNWIPEIVCSMDLGTSSFSNSDGYSGSGGDSGGGDSGGCSGGDSGGCSGGDSGGGGDGGD